MGEIAGGGGVHDREQPIHLLEVERQVVAAQSQQRVVGPLAGDLQIAAATAGQHDLGFVRQSAEQRRQRVRGGGGLEVVDDDSGCAARRLRIGLERRIDPADDASTRRQTIAVLTQQDGLAEPGRRRDHHRRGHFDPRRERLARQ